MTVEIVMTLMNQMMLQSIAKATNPATGLVSESSRTLITLLILVTIIVSILGVTQNGGST